MAIKKHDFIELDYTGKLKDTNQVFDTTSEAVAKQAKIYSERGDYSPVIICVGEQHILAAIDEFLQGKEVGTYTLDLPAEKAFGKKDPKLMKMVPAAKFTEQGIKPMVGLRLNIDGMIGMVRSVTGGRVVVDFNHPLAGKDVVYELAIKHLVTDKKAQVQSLLRVLLGLKDAEVTVSEDAVTLSIPALPPPIQDELAKKITELTGLKVAYAKKEPAEATEKKSAKKKE
jgi:FKBP-type peptidyl-prolyl cis-trans isomerase 2